MGWTSRVHILVGKGTFLQNMQTGSGAHQAPIHRVPRLFPGGEVAGV